MSQRPALALLLMVAGELASCGDSFTPAQPLLGHVDYEWQGTVPAEGIHIKNPNAPVVGFAEISVPPNAVPAGTTMTVRQLSRLNKNVPSGWPLPAFDAEVLQILPEDLTFAQPLTYTSFSRVSDGQVLIGHMFRAGDGDAAWTWSSFDWLDPTDLHAPLSWPIDRPGLWIRGDAASSIQGTYRLWRASCGAGVMPTALNVYLTVAADHYSLTGTEPACHDEGAFVGSPFTLTSGQRAVGFDVMVLGTSIRLKAEGDFLGTCGGSGSFVLFLDYAGCATDVDCGAGAQCAGDLCVPLPSSATASCLADVTGVTGGK